MVRAVEEEKLEIPSTESQNVNGWRLTRKETIRARNISKADDSASPTVNQDNAPSGMSSSSSLRKCCHIFPSFIQM
ncbi:hypothetical protein CQW23_11288 [Capsicum baccatum]|uniref:Uncharacterized protein n=1 Tax=Capsicum baccatum TaxID=33114 RepID=A0A2G2WPJ0_CAPBA|nr:hypothetical protein CQW23_11288 [Capsicum baccatum]